MVLEDRATESMSDLAGPPKTVPTAVPGENEGLVEMGDIEAETGEK